MLKMELNRKFVVLASKPQHHPHRSRKIQRLQLQPLYRILRLGLSGTRVGRHKGINVLTVLHVLVIEQIKEAEIGLHIGFSDVERISSCQVDAMVIIEVGKATFRGDCTPIGRWFFAQFG